MSESTICNFGNIQERDMDMMFLECLLTDDGFLRLFLRKAEITGISVEVLNVALSETDPEYGESDITALLSVDGKKHALLYEKFHVFIVCPKAYYKANEEAKKYANFITYEDCIEYFSKKTDTLSKIRCAQLNQAKAKGPGSTWEKNEKAMAFFEKYRTYMATHGYDLDLRNKKDSNGWWPHYGTSFGNAYIYHKVSDGVVDLTFPNGANDVSTLKLAAIWLNAHGVPNIQALQTGKAAALRIKVPVLDQHKPFEEADMDDVEACFKAVQELSNLATAVGQISGFVKTK